MGSASLARRAGAVAIGAAIASAAAGVLQWAGLLDGPALVGGTGFGESMVVIAAAAAVGFGAAVATGSRPARSLSAPSPPGRITIAR